MEADTHIDRIDHTIQKKRPDRAQALKNKKFTREVVIKKSLIGSLKLESIYPVISRWVVCSSQAMNRGSLVFNRFLIHYLTRNLELPDFSDKNILNFYIHCFKVGVRSIPDSRIQSVWDDYFQKNNFPSDQKWIGDGQMYVYVSKAYKTMFENSLKFTFEQRQKSYIRNWIQKNSVDKSSFHSIQCAVNGWKCKFQPPEEALDFIEHQRKMLDPPKEGITLDWLGKHLNTIIVYFWEILKSINLIENVRKFNIAPIHSIGSHFLTIDTKILYYILKESKIISDLSEKEFRSQREKYYKQIFRFKSSAKKVFSYTIQTDGVSICFHYETPKQETHESKFLSERRIGIDPGRSNLIYGTENTPEGVQTYRLTRKTYYSQAGMTKRNKQASNWQKEIVEEERIFSLFSPKTSDSNQWDSFLVQYISVYNKLWEVKTGKKWARAKFRIYGLKRKVLDRFFNKMNGPIKPVIFFGAAKFNPNSKNELSSPTTSISKACARHFKVVMVDEFRTSKICANCDCKLSPVQALNIEGKIREIRGLRRCSSSVCAQTSYKNRDLNAALNILRCNLESRPKSLTRGTEISEVRPWTIRQAQVKKVKSKKLSPLSQVSSTSDICVRCGP